MFSGADKAAIEAKSMRESYEFSRLLDGSATKTIYLSGGSDTRRDAYEHQRDRWERLGVKVEYFGWCVVIGGSLT